MRVVQWNTHHSGVGSDGKLQPERIARTLAALHADVACLQEVERFTGYGQFDPIEKWCGILGADWHGVFCTCGGVVDGKGPGTCILSRLPMTLVHAKGLVNNRAVLQATISGRRITCVHLDNTSAALRNIEGTQINGWPPVTEPGALVLAGDWNAVSGAVELAPFEHWYHDAWIDALKAGTATAFNTTGVTRHSRIDIVYSRGLTLKGCTVPDTRIEGIFPSDHSPVVAEFL
jgi:endonuclease/exonuclease/phosphatase family metal-dependent hydrolase